MGIAKTMNAIGEYNFYSSDYNQFIEKLGQLFQVNIQAHFFDNGYFYGEDFNEAGFIEIEPHLYDFHFSETFRVEVEFDKYDYRQNFPENRYCNYKLFIPVKLQNEKELTLHFYGNGIFQLDYLPFSNFWRFFIEDVFGLTSRIEVIQPILEIRECYIEILRKINCTEIIIWTDAHYKSEDVFLYNKRPGKKYNLNDVKKTMKELDGIHIIPFLEAIKHEIKIISKREDYFDIAFVDNFNNRL